MDPSEDAPSIDEMDLNLFYGDATCIDTSHKEPQTYISDVDLEEAVDKSGVSVNEGDTLLLYTGAYNRYYGKVDYLSQYPGLDE